MFRALIWLRASRTQLWFTAACATLLAVLLAMAAKWLNGLFDVDSVPSIDAGTIKSLLGVIASSMLAVATFSLGSLMQAFGAVSQSASPRAIELLMGDRGISRGIASFIGAFIYSIVAITALGVGYYGPVGRFVLFLSTLAVLAYLVVRLVLWVKALSTLGRLGDTLGRLARSALDEFEALRLEPRFGAGPAPAQAPQGVPICPDRIGYLTHIDMDALDEFARAHACVVHVRVRPGALVAPQTPMAVVVGHAALGASSCRQLMACFVVSAAPTFRQDPGHAIRVLSEVAQRALSPAVNDPGTAMLVVTSIGSVLSRAAASDAGTSAANVERAKRITAPDLDRAALVRDGFEPIARDGAGLIELQLHLQRVLHAVRVDGCDDAGRQAEQVAAHALARGLKALDLPHERDALQQLHRALFGAVALG